MTSDPSEPKPYTKTILYKTPSLRVICLIRFRCQLSGFTFIYNTIFNRLSSLEYLPLQPILLQALSQEAELALPKRIVED
jgi:hypothetical protein